MTRCNKHGTTIIDGICNHCEYTKPKTSAKKNEGQ
jgi:hypothetical protein